MTEQPVANKQTQPNIANKPKFFKKPFIAGSKPQQQMQQQPQQSPQIQQQQKPQFKK